MPFIPYPIGILVVGIRFRLPRENRFNCPIQELLAYNRGEQLFPDYPLRADRFKELYQMDLSPYNRIVVVERWEVVRRE